VGSLSEVQPNGPREEREAKGRIGTEEKTTKEEGD